MEDYQKRMVEEYNELKERADKLNTLLGKERNGLLDFELSCPLELLNAQYNTMRAYQAILKRRARIEGVPLND